LETIRDGSLSEFVAPIRAVFVDEYQDTDYVQESIYFSLLQQSGGWATLTVVGDDDQALYRFRGATVELFQDYEHRLQSTVSVSPQTIYLSSNYRSTSNIVEFCDAYVKLDTTYAGSRIGTKPDLDARRDPSTYENYPIIGVFRPTLTDVADALAAILDDVINGSGFSVPGTNFTISRHAQGTAGDCALLCGSPREHAYDDTPRLPRLLRDRLAALASPIAVFNPRGIAFHAIPEVEILGVWVR
jgi:DNA helicase-2/ATP-dependent DNA helicase PcrA